MQGILETQRVYQELGSPKELDLLIDNPPKFHLQADVPCRLFEENGDLVPCRLYVFNGALLIGSNNTKKQSRRLYNPVILADIPKSKRKEPVREKSHSRVSKLDAAEMESELYKSQELADEREKRSAASFNLELYAAFAQTYPSLYYDSKQQAFCARFTQIYNEKGKGDSYVVVNEVEVWFDKSTRTVLQKVFGNIQENLWKLYCIARTPKMDRSMGRSMKNRMNKTRKRPSRTSQRGNKRAKEGLEKREHLRSKLKMSGSAVPGDKTSLKPISTVSQNENIVKEPDKFVVSFGPKQKGFVVNKEGVVTDVVPWGLADAAGVCIGDRVDMMNGREADHSMFSLIDFPDQLEICFSRTYQENSKTTRKDNFKSENSARASITRDNNAEEFEELFFRLLVKKTAPFMSDSEDSESETEEKEVLAEKEYQKIPKKSIQRMMASKGKIWLKMRRGFQVQVETFKAEFQKQLTAREQKQVEQLFDEMIAMLDLKEEKLCVHALKEIYTTEAGYLKTLHMLVDAREIISEIKRNLVCKETQTGKFFCEHKNVRRVCQQQSKTRTQAVPNEELDKIFLNMKSIISVHSRIESGLRRGLHKLYVRSGRDEVTVEDILGVFCTEFTSIAPFLSMYTNYIQRYSFAVEYQKTLRQDNTYFNMGIQQVEDELKIRFMSLINKPLQRVTKYPLLFSSLEKYVKKFIKKEKSAHNDDSQPLNLAKMALGLANASRVVKQVVDKVNLKVGKAKDLEVMSRVYDEIGGKNKIENLLQPWRRFKGEFELSKYTYGLGSDGEEQDDSILFVFSDMIVPAKQFGRIGRRDSTTSITNVARKAKGNISSTLSRSSMRLISSAATTATKTGSRLSRFRRKKRKSTRDQKLDYRPPVKSGNFGFKDRPTQAGNNLGINKSSNTPRPPPKLRSTTKSSASSSVRQRSTRRNSKDSPEKEAPVRDLTPLQQIQLKNINFRSTEEGTEDEDYFYSVTYEYEDTNASGSSLTDPSEYHGFELTLFFKEESKRDEFVNLIGSIKEEIKMKDMDWKKVRMLKHEHAVTNVV